MICNQRQLSLARAKIAWLRARQRVLSRTGRALDLTGPLDPPRLLEEQLAQLSRQVEDYENLRRAQTEPPDLRLAQQLPVSLIQARIWLGWNQKQLAENAGLPEKTVQRYEATRYASVKLSRVQAISEILLRAIAEERKIFEKTGAS